MKLSDIMGNAGLSMYAQVALVIFLAVFIAVTIRTWAPSRRRQMQEDAMLPLNDDMPAVRGREG
ncbi:MAG: cbb3-type cytochrome c oxidase subunit 3 [Gemmatimonadaceae bacterium]|jgi:cbb3-type cytochrome oxidase subunit 3|nr:cbb3-type cytochrome c oxidase subunit 3 [Gemmatimonadaceae bacterium]MCC6430397.1 cbb3-type cytochrome c oxidase subunit 3 [Gemmatimonadaceae bacterium]